MSKFSKLGYRAFSILLFAIFAAFTFVGTEAQAGCRFVPAPCNQGQTQQNYYEQNEYSESNYRRTDNVVTIVTDDYNQSYLERPQVTRREVQVRSNRQYTKAKASQRSNHRVNSHRKSHHVTSHVRQRPVVARSSRTYQSSRASNQVRRPYVMPVKDHAATYRASYVGNSVAIATFAGRGESWVSGRGQIIRYSAPQFISVQNGRNCGWGMQIAQNGESGRNRAWVCHCEHGWQPPH
jgi:hypothetical protein